MSRKLFFMFLILLVSNPAFCQEMKTEQILEMKLIDISAMMADSITFHTKIDDFAKAMVKFKECEVDSLDLKDVDVDSLSAVSFLRSGPASDNDYSNGGPQNMIDKFSIKPSVGNIGADFKNLENDLNKGKVGVNIPLFDFEYYDLKIPVFLNNNYPTNMSNVMGDPLFYTDTRVGGDWNLSCDAYKVARQLNGVEDEHPTKGYYSSFSQSKVNGTSNISNSDVANGLKGNWDPKLDVFHFITPTVSGSFIVDLNNNVCHNLTDGSFFISYTKEDNKLTSFTVTDNAGNKFLFGGDATSIEQTQSRSDDVSSGFDDAVRIKFLLEVEQEYGGNGWQYHLKSLAIGAVNTINLFTPNYPYGVGPLATISANDLLNQIYDADGIINSTQMSRMVSLGNDYYGILNTDEYFYNRASVLQNRMNDQELRVNSVNTGWYLRRITLVNGKRVTFNYQNSWEAYRTRAINRTKVAESSGFNIRNSANQDVQINANYYVCMPYQLDPMQFPVNETFVLTYNYVRKPKLIQFFDEEMISEVRVDLDIAYNDRVLRPYILPPYLLQQNGIPVPQDVLDGGIINPYLIKNISLIKNNRYYKAVFNQVMNPGSNTNGQRVEWSDVSKLNSVVINDGKRYSFEYNGRLLKKIIYPTGGTKEFDLYGYYKNPVKFNYLGSGGTRTLTNYYYVKSIKTTDENTTTLETYDYVGDNPAQSNILRYDTYTKDWFKTFRPTVAACTTEASFSSSSPLYNSSPIKGGILFKSVKKFVNGDLALRSDMIAENGTFLGNSFIQVGMNASNPPGYLSNIWRPSTVYEDKIGNTYLTTSYKEDALGNPVEDSSSSYSYNYTTGFLLYPSVYLMNIEAGPFSGTSGAIRRGYSHYFFPMAFEKNQITQITKTKFPNYDITQTKTSFYRRFRSTLGTNNRVIYKESTFNSRGENWKKYYKYIDDVPYANINSPLFQYMKFNNVFPPIEITTTKLATYTSGSSNVTQDKPFDISVNKFKLISNGTSSYAVMGSQLKAETNDVINNLTNSNSSLLTVQQDPLNSNNILYDNIIKEKVVYDQYDSDGRLTEFHTTDGPHTTIIWGYKGQYPIAKIENAKYSDVSAYVANLKNLSNLDYDNCKLPACKEQALRVALNALRQTPNSSNWQVTTYTYDYDSGITSVTNPIGDTSYYEYDNLHRLKKVVDAQGNVISEHDYNFKP